MTGSSRAATDDLLALLEDRRPLTWARFIASATQRSVRQAVLRPRALAEVTAIHAAAAALAPQERRAWILTSWALSATHLGMLEQHRSIGAANAITLLRANLPALVDHRCTAVAALVTDIADGRMARRRGTVSPFGAAADSLADAAFWLWFAHRHEPSPWVRAAAWLAWAAPVATVTAASVLGGQMLDPPRPDRFRPAAALQVVLTVGRSPEPVEGRRVVLHGHRERRGQLTRMPPGYYAHPWPLTRKSRTASRSGTAPK